MAKKNITSQEKGKEKKTNTIKLFLKNEHAHFIFGLILMFFTLYVGLSLVSFFFTGAADQSKIENILLADLLTSKGAVLNWTGVRGAFLSDLLMNRWFGISSFMILFFFGSVSAKMMKLKNISLLKRFLFSGSTLIWGSLFFAFVFLKGYEDTFLYLGGQHGYYMSEVMIQNIGAPGTVLLLLVSFLIIATFTSNKTIPLLQFVLSFAWMKRSKNGNKDKNTMPDPVIPEADIFADNKESQENEKKPYSEGKIETVIDIPGEDDDEFQITVPGEEDMYDDTVSRQESDSDSFSVEIPEGDDEILEGEEVENYDPKLDLSSFRSPTLESLKKYDLGDHQVDMEEQVSNQKKIKETLENFGISIVSIKATVGPTITLYEVIPDKGVRISKIKNLEDDIALSLAALGIRIIAPIPGKGTIGIEVPNKDAQIVSMHSVIASRKFQEAKYELPVALGKTITNEVFMFDLCKMPHLLVAGATGQGKSVGLNAIITSLLYKKHPSELKLVLVDPKMVEFSIYSSIEKHYLAMLPDADKPIITDFNKVIYTLNSLCKEMDDRYDLLMKAHTRNIKEYNEKFITRRLNPLKGHKYMPYIVVIIDEFGDLIMTAGKEIELPIARIAQKARAVGIHMIIATQRPTTNIITGTIKANFPARMAFRVTSSTDSRTILDGTGANQLIGRGDLLFSQGSDMVRVQCAFVDTPEVEQISNFIGDQVGYPTAFQLPEYVSEGEGDKMPGAIDLSDRDPLFDDAARLIIIHQQGSTSLIQRKLSLGYNRAGRLMDQLEAAGIVGPFEGSKARKVLVQDEYGLEQILNSLK